VGYDSHGGATADSHGAGAATADENGTDLHGTDSHAATADDGHRSRSLSGGGDSEFVRYRCDEHYHNQVLHYTHTILYYTHTPLTGSCPYADGVARALEPGARDRDAVERGAPLRHHCHARLPARIHAAVCAPAR
jgi:hypothetical protein